MSSKYLNTQAGYNREYRKGAIYRITINLSDESGGDDGNVRAAREMATIATRQPGFISLDSIEHGGKTTAYVLLWSTLEAIDIWRSGIYETALNRYGHGAWKTFENISLETVDLPSHSTPSPIQNAAQNVTEKVRNVFSLAKIG